MVAFGTCTETLISKKMEISLYNKFLVIATVVAVLGPIIFVGFNVLHAASQARKRKLARLAKAAE